jgi:predicted negative regulator of RcsB-dependent stress response
MAKHLDLEEQEQLDQIKHFWNQYGNLITWMLILVFGSFAAWNGWQYWQRSQATQAAALYDEIERASLARDTARTTQALADMQSRFASTTYAAQGALLAGKTLFEAGQVDAARAALVWVTEKSSDEAYQAVGRLRLAGLDIEAQAFDAAWKTLSAPVPSTFEPLVADRRGDVLMAQGKSDAAREQYLGAWRGMDARTEYRRLVEVKLAALGVDVSSLPPIAEAKP